MPAPSVSIYNTLVREVREKHDIKLLAAETATGISKSVINRYELGRQLVSVDYYSRLLQLTDALGMLRPLYPKLRILSDQSTIIRTPPPGDPRDLLAAELLALKKLTAAAGLVERIVRDGVVDDTDDIMLIKLAGHHTEAINLFTKVDAALVAYRDQSERNNLGGDR